MTDQERQNLTDLRQAISDRLQVLRLQQARLGPRTPPEIVNEIREAMNDLVALAPIADQKVSDRLIEELRRFGQPSQVCPVAGLMVVQVAMLILLVALAGRLLPC